jgi:hypothetical protein
MPRLLLAASLSAVSSIEKPQYRNCYRFIFLKAINGVEQLPASGFLGVTMTADKLCAGNLCF